MYSRQLGERGPGRLQANQWSLSSKLICPLPPGKERNLDVMLHTGVSNLLISIQLSLWKSSAVATHIVSIPTLQIRSLKQRDLVKLARGRSSESGSPAPGNMFLHLHYSTKSKEYGFSGNKEFRFGGNKFSKLFWQLHDEIGEQFYFILFFSVWRNTQNPLWPPKLMRKQFHWGIYTTDIARMFMKTYVQAYLLLCLWSQKTGNHSKCLAIKTN